MTRHAHALVLALAGCAPAHGESDTVRIRYYPSLQQHSAEALDEASEILGLEIEIVDAWNAIVAEVRKTNDFHGETLILGRCARTFWADDDYPRSVAHELGHALGLRHVDDDRGNLMFPGSAGESLTPEQVEQTRRGAWTIEHCPR